MVDYSQPVKATFELQRQSLEQGHRALEQAVDFQHRAGAATIDGLEAGESLQHSAGELHRAMLHSALDAVEANVPGTDEAVTEMRETLDEQYETLLDTHAAVFEQAVTGLEDGLDGVSEMNDDSLAVLADQLDSFSETHEELEARSIEATEEITEQFEAFERQIEEMQTRMQNR